nr:MAG TPA: hypothetical protein [Caudoviricetes sp.]
MASFFNLIFLSISCVFALLLTLFQRPVLQRLVHVGLLL